VRRVYVTAVCLLVLGVGVTVAGPSAAAPACEVPHLRGLTVQSAQARARHAHCALRLRGAPVTRPEIQTVQRQSPKPDAMSDRAISAWVNPLCSDSAALGGPRGEPIKKSGPTELITGLYLVGGPHRWRSAPNCEALEGTPGPGTIQVTNSQGAIVASMSVAQGRLATIPLPPGTYTVSGTFDGATINGTHPARTAIVEIPAGTTVRRDLDLGIP
jgi:hypothetical protein